MQDFISTDPAILNGAPVIKGTRISVALIEEWLINQSSIEDIVKEFPQLTIEAVQFIADTLKLKTLIELRELLNKAAQLKAISIDDFNENTEMELSYINVLDKINKLIESLELKTGVTTKEQLDRIAKNFARKCTFAPGIYDDKP